MITESELQEVRSLARKPYYDYKSDYDYDAPAATRLREILRDKGYDGLKYPNGVEGDGYSYAAFYPEQVITTDIYDAKTEWDTRDEPKRHYSLIPADAAADATATAPATVATLPAKAQTYLRRERGKFYANVRNALGVTKFGDRAGILQMLDELANEYLQTGSISDGSASYAFERIYDEGIKLDERAYREYQQVAEYFKTQKLTLSPDLRSDMGDYEFFRKSSFGTLHLVNDGGAGIDSAYAELRGMAPELFPAELSDPTQQLRHMLDVARDLRRVERTLDEYHGESAEDYRLWAKNDFMVALEQYKSALHDVARYAEDRAAKEDFSKYDEITPENIYEAYKGFKDARRAYERVSDKQLLTSYDNAQVARLLKGEITLKDLDPKRANVRGIRAVYEAKQEYDARSRVIAEYKRRRKAKLYQSVDSFLEKADTFKDKSSGIAYARETMERNVRDIVPDKGLAQDIIREFFAPVHTAQAQATRLKRELRDRVRALNLSRRVKNGDLVSESHAVQLYGEAMDNIRMLEASRKPGEIRDGKDLAEWRQCVANLKAENPGLDFGKIERAVGEFRKIYDELFNEMNEVRVRNGYEPIDYRSGYFPHFQPGETGLLATIGKELGIDGDVTALPTTINGLTHTFKPGIQWFGNAQERLGFNTAYDAVEGFDKYIEGAADIIYQTDNIQKLRALASRIRYRTGDEGIKRQIDAVLANETLDESQKQPLIDALSRDGKFALSNFAVALDEYTNLLANKKSHADRQMEQDAGRRAYNISKKFMSRIAANMVAVNPASWLTNFIPLTQGGAQLHRFNLLHGMFETLRSLKSDDGIIERSTFLTNRRGSDPLVRSWSEGMSAKLSSPMEMIDQFTAGSLVRARYRQNLQQGMSEASAMEEADAWAAGVMADRSKGSMPTLFNRTNPATKVLTQFQLEVNNQFSYIFKDIPREEREKGLAALAAVLLKFMLGAFFYNEVYELFVGRRPALDPIGILNETVGDLFGYELPNLVELGKGTITGELSPTDPSTYEAERETLVDSAVNLGKNVAEELPFVGGLLGGGRVPISSALPDGERIVSTLNADKMSAGDKALKIGGEIAKTAGAYLVAPFGGGQAKKIVQGATALARGGSYSMDNEGNDILQYPIKRTAVNVARTLIFGKTSTPEGQKWVEGGFKSLGAKQTAAYQAMLESEVEDSDAYELLENLRAIDSLEDNSIKQKEKLRILEESDISGEGKYAVYYHLFASAPDEDSETKSEQELMDELEGMGSEAGEVVGVLLNMKQAGELKGAAASNAKRDAIVSSRLTPEQKKVIYREKISETRDDEIAALEAAGISFDEFLEIQNEYATVNEEYETSSEKAIEFSRWVTQRYSKAKADVIRANFTYFSQIPAEAKNYNNFMTGGMSDASAAKLAKALNALEPAEGQKSVSAAQKYRAVLDARLPVKEVAIAFENVMSDSDYMKYTVAKDESITDDMFVVFKEKLATADTDESGSLSQAELKAAINAMSSSAALLPSVDPKTFNLTSKQKAVLWQLGTGGKPANNPYNKVVATRVSKALDKLKEEAEE